MIYSAAEPAAPIQQGDIFVSVPRCDVDFARFLHLAEEDETEPRDWLELSPPPGTEVQAVVGFRAVPALVITPDCDAVRSDFLTLCEIVPLTSINPSFGTVKHPKNWVPLFQRQLVQSQNWFYLPELAELGGKKMAVDFRQTIRIARLDAERFKPRLRTRHLSDLGRENLRHRLGEYIGGFASDEWYPFNQEEFATYNEIYGGTVKPFPGQMK